MNVKRLLSFVAAASCLLAAVPADAQKALRPAGEALLLNNFQVKLPQRVLKFHQEDIEAIFLNTQLPAQPFGNFALKNNRETLLSLQRFVQNFDQFVKDGPSFIQYLKSKVFLSQVPYGKMLPRNIDYLYIGEVHDSKRVQQEVKRILTLLPTWYPGRRIYLATEFVFVNEKSRPNRRYNKLLTTRQEVAEALENKSNSSVEVVLAAVDRGIAVLGVEPQYELAARLALEMDRLPNEDEFFDFVISPIGMALRNEAWTKAILQLRARDPQALIVVYAGADHLGYHQEHSVASALGGKGFSVFVATPDRMATNNPLFAHITEDQEKIEKFLSSPEAKLVEYWDRPNPGIKTMGWNMTVLVH